LVGKDRFVARVTTIISLTKLEQSPGSLAIQPTDRIGQG